VSRCAFFATCFSLCRTYGLLRPHTVVMTRKYYLFLPKILFRSPKILFHAVLIPTIRTPHTLHKLPSPYMLRWRRSPAKTFFRRSKFENCSRTQIIPYSFLIHADHHKPNPAQITTDKFQYKFPVEEWIYKYNFLRSLVKYVNPLFYVEFFLYFLPDFSTVLVLGNASVSLSIIYLSYR